MKRTLLLAVVITPAIMLTACFGPIDATQGNQTTTTTAESTTITTSATTKGTTIRVTNTETRATMATTTVTTTKQTTTEATTTEPITRDELDGFCKKYKYKDIARMPDDYEGKFVKFSGEVVQVMEDDEFTYLRIAESSDYDQMWFVLYMRPKGYPRVLEDDQVDVYAMCIGLYSYESTLGSTISIPGATTEWIFID